MNYLQYRPISDDALSSEPGRGYITLQSPKKTEWEKRIIMFCKVGETGAPWDMGHPETGLFDTEIILRFVRYLVDDTKTDNFFNFPPQCLLLLEILGMYISLGQCFTWKVLFWDVQYLFLKITWYLIYLWFWWYITPVLSLYNLCIIVGFKYTRHTNYDIRCEVSQGGAPWDALRRCLNVPQNCLYVPQGCLKVPPLFSRTYCYFYL